MRRAWTVVAVAAAAFTALSIGPVADALLGGLDRAVADTVADLSEPTRHAWDVVADVMVYGIAAALCTGTVTIAAGRRDLPTGTAVAFLLIAMAANDTILKPFFDRPRPPTAYLDTPAFPSGHTTAALLVSAAILFPRITPRRIGLVAMVAVATAAARILSGAHWVSDVLGSIAYGTLVVALVRTNGRVVAPTSSGA